MSTAATAIQQPEQDAVGRGLYNQIFKASVIYSIAGFVPLIAGMGMLPVYTRFLKPSDYGLLELLDATRTVFSMLVGARYTESLLFFYGRAKTEAERERTVSTVIWGSVALGIVTCLLGWACAPMLTRILLQQGGDAINLRLVLLAFGLSLPIEANLAWFRAKNRAREYLILSLVRLLLTLVTSVLCLVFFHDKVEGVLAGNLAVAAAVMLYLVLRFAATHGGPFEWKRFVVQMRFGFLLTATGAAVFVIHFGDRFFLQRYTSLAEVGLYGLAYKCGMVVSVVQSAFAQYWGGQVYRVVASDEGLVRFQRIHTYLMFALCYMAVIVSASAGPLFRIMVPATYQSAAAYVPWIALTYVVRAHGDYFRSALYVEGLPGADTGINIAASLTCVGLYWLLIPSYGAYGAVFATVVAFALVSVLAWIRVSGRRNYTIEFSRSGKGFVLALACGLLFASLQSRSFAWQVLALAGGIAGYPLMLYITGVFTSDERSFIQSIPSLIRVKLAERFV